MKPCKIIITRFRAVKSVWMVWLCVIDFLVFHFWRIYNWYLKYWMEAIYKPNIESNGSSPKNTAIEPQSQFYFFFLTFVFKWIVHFLCLSFFLLILNATLNQTFLFSAVTQQLYSSPVKKTKNKTSLMNLINLIVCINAAHPSSGFTWVTCSPSS